MLPNRILDWLANNEIEVKVDAIDEARLMEGHLVPDPRLSRPRDPLVPARRRRRRRPHLRNRVLGCVKRRRLRYAARRGPRFFLRGRLVVARRAARVAFEGLCRVLLAASTIALLIERETSPAPWTVARPASAAAAMLRRAAGAAMSAIARPTCCVAASAALAASVATLTMPTDALRA